MRRILAVAFSAAIAFAMFPPSIPFAAYASSAWSDWSTTSVAASANTEVQSKVQYRYRDKQSTTSTNSSLSGWTRDGSSRTVYGGWSSNKTTTSKPKASDTLKIVSSKPKEYHYYHWHSKYNGIMNQDSGWVNNTSVRHEITRTTPLPGPQYFFPDQGGHANLEYGPGDTCAWKPAKAYWWLDWITTTYTYQTRSKATQYGYYKWGDWSGWSDTSVTASANRKVETRTVYRYRTNSSTSNNSGSVAGYVCDAAGGAPLKGASVQVCNARGAAVAHGTSDSSGRYCVIVGNPGSYTLKVVYGGRIILTCKVNVSRNTTCYAERATLVKKCSQKGVAKGRVNSATTGKAVKGATLLFRKGWNCTSGKVVKKVKTNKKGKYSAKLKCGYYTVCAKRKGYITTTFNVVVKKGTTGNQNGTISPKQNKSNKYRVVLTWGSSPADLDSHLVATGSNGYHVYYRNMRPRATANLDVDDTTSYGPETVTFTAENNTTYRYYVYKYSDSGKRLQQSSAKVKVYKGNQLVKTYNVPTGGSGRYWNVFTLRNGNLAAGNTVTSDPTGIAAVTAAEGK